MKKLRIKLGVIVAAVLMLGTVVLSAGPAAADPIVWNHTGGSIPMFYAPTSVTGVEAWMPESSHFQMICWVDWQWYYGNYWTNRWFWGQSQRNGVWAWVNASYVYYQVGVPHC